MPFLHRRPLRSARAGAFAGRSAAPALVLGIVGLTAAVGVFPLGVSSVSGRDTAPIILDRGVTRAEPTVTVADQRLTAGRPDGAAASAAAAEADRELDPAFSSDGRVLKPIAPVPPRRGAAPFVRYYRAVHGDSIWSISRRFGIGTMTLWWANVDRLRTGLRVGALLAIPPRDGVLHRVVEGDTLDGIASDYRSTPERLATENALRGDVVVLGQMLMIRDGKGERYPEGSLPERKPAAEGPVATRPSVDDTHDAADGLAPGPSETTGGTDALAHLGGATPRHRSALEYGASVQEALGSLDTPAHPGLVGDAALGPTTPVEAAVTPPHATVTAPQTTVPRVARGTGGADGGYQTDTSSPGIANSPAGDGAAPASDHAALTGEPAGTGGTAERVDTVPVGDAAGDAAPAGDAAGDATPAGEAAGTPVASTGADTDPTPATATPGITSARDADGLYHIGSAGDGAAGTDQWGLAISEETLADWGATDADLHQDRLWTRPNDATVASRQIEAAAARVEARAAAKKRATAKVKAAAAKALREAEKAAPPPVPSGTGPREGDSGIADEDQRTIPALDPVAARKAASDLRSDIQRYGGPHIVATRPGQRDLPDTGETVSGVPTTAQLLKLPAKGPDAKAHIDWLSWPLRHGRITQLYWGGHHGVDIVARKGSLILSAAYGQVVWAGWRDNGGGYQVWVRHAPGLYTGYYHLSKVVVRIGQKVARGKAVGVIGATGYAFGTHLHFELWRNGVPGEADKRMNPLRYTKPA